MLAADLKLQIKFSDPMKICSETNKTFLPNAVKKECSFVPL